MTGELNNSTSGEPKGRKMGPPSKCTPEVVDRLLRALADGLTKEQAAIAAGISRETLNRWQREKPELAEQLGQAREQARQKALAIIKQAAVDGDYNAAVQFLRFSFHPDYCKPDTKVQVTAQAGIQLVCDEQTRARLIELRQKLLSGETNKLPELTTED